MLLATVSGYVSKAELSSTQNGKEVLNFSVAHSEKIKGVDKTTWVRCSLFGARATALAGYIDKGTHVTAVGQLKLGVYAPTGKEPSMNVDLMVSDISFINNKASGNQEAPAKSEQQAQPEDPFGDDVPF